MIKLDIRWQFLLGTVCAVLFGSLLIAPRSERVKSIIATREAQKKPTPTLDATAVANQCFADISIDGGVFFVGVIGAPRQLYPLLSNANPVDQKIVDLVYDGLVRLDAQGHPKPALAQAWTISEDGKTIRMELRSDVAWHDGNPFTSADVVFTTELWKSADSSLGISKVWSTLIVRAIDEYTVEFELPERFSPFLELLSQGILPVHLLDGIPASELADHPFNRQPMGTGPFIVVQDWIEDGVLSLRPNPNYWRVPTALEGVEIRFFANEAEQLAAWKKGELNGIIDLSDSLAPTFDRLAEARLATSAESHYTQLIFNFHNENSPLQTLELRQAIAYALDRKEIMQSAVYGQGILFDGPYVTNSWAYNPKATQYATNLISATTLLSDTGWITTTDQTIRVQADSLTTNTVEITPTESLTKSTDISTTEKITTTESVTTTDSLSNSVTVSETTPLSNTGPITLSLKLLTLDTKMHKKIAELIETQLEAVGIDIVVEKMGFEKYREALKADQFDLALLEVEPLHDPDLYGFWSQSAIRDGQNYGGWNNRFASEALEEARQKWEIDERLPLYDRFIYHFDDKLPAIPLFQFVTNDLWQASVSGVEIGRIHSPRDYFNSFPDWRILTEKRAVPCEE